MPVNSSTHQPMGILHGGASVSLAESIGSVGSNLLIDTKSEYAVGLSQLMLIMLEVQKMAMFMG